MIRWEVKRIKDVTIKVGSGSTPRGGQRVYMEEGPYTLIRSQNVYDYEFKKYGLVYIDEEQASRLNNVALQENDILLNITGDSVGRCCIVPKEILPARVNQHVAIIRVDENTNPYYLMYYLNDKRNKEKLLNFVHGGTRKALTKGIIEDFDVEIPSLEIQNRIADILSTYDRKIKSNVKINQILEEMALTIYKYYFIDCSPFHDREIIETEFGMIPKGWQVGSLSSIANILMGQSPKSEFYNQYGDGLPFHQGVKDFGDRFPSHVTYCTKELRVANAGDILVSVRAPVGRLNITDKKIIIGRGLAALSPKLDYYSFLLYTLKHLFAVEDQYGSGTVFNSITKKDLESLPVIIPDEDQIKEFEERVSKYDALIAKHSKEINMLIQTRDYLLPRLLSGEIDVTKAEKQIKEVL